MEEFSWKCVPAGIMVLYWGHEGCFYRPELWQLSIWMRRTSTLIEKGSRREYKRPRTYQATMILGHYVEVIWG